MREIRASSRECATKIRGQAAAITVCNPLHHFLMDNAFQYRFFEKIGCSRTSIDKD